MPGCVAKCMEGAACFAEFCKVESFDVTTPFNGWPQRFQRNLRTSRSDALELPAYPHLSLLAAQFSAVEKVPQPAESYLLSYPSRPSWLSRLAHSVEPPNRIRVPLQTFP